MKVYCYQCGAASQYTIEKPKFCMRCGCALDATSASKLPAAETDTKIADEKINTQPMIGQLEVEIDASAGFEIKLGDLAGNSTGGTSDDDFKAPKIKQKSEEQFLEDFKKEAGETRPRPKK